jgi:glycogen operon protein
MLLAGDELDHSQQGNNNAYCQDNQTTWLAWGEGTDEGTDRTLPAFVARLAALRREAPALRSMRWWPAEQQRQEAPGIRWLRPDGQPMAPADWNNGGTALAILFEAQAVPNATSAWLVLVNAGPTAVAFHLPAGKWQGCLATDPEHDPGAVPRPLADVTEVPHSSLWIARR